MSLDEEMDLNAERDMEFKEKLEGELKRCLAQALDRQRKLFVENLLELANHEIDMSKSTADLGMIQAHRYASKMMRAVAMVEMRESSRLIEAMKPALTMTQPGPPSDVI